MTREENIRAILECCFAGYKDELIDIACKRIYELSQEPCDDAISREDRLLDLANAIESDDSGYWTNKRISSALRNIPPVTQKSGEWIGVNPMVDTLMCSECGENIISADFKSNYCPNCGAKMESEDKE